MDKIEEVKRILDRYFVAGMLTTRNAAVEICQLFQEPEKCPECKGWGFLHEYDEKTKGNKTCGVCKGTGIEPLERSSQNNGILYYRVKMSNKESSVKCPKLDTCQKIKMVLDGEG